MSTADRRQAPTAEPQLDLGSRLALTLPEVARALGLSERHVRDLRAELPCVTLGRRVAVPIDDLHAWLRNRAEAERAGGLEAVGEVLPSLGDDQVMIQYLTNTTTALSGTPRSGAKPSCIAGTPPTARP